MSGAELCPGHRTTSGRLLGLCIACQKLCDDGRMTPAVRRDQAAASWRCVNFEPIRAVREAPLPQATNQVKVVPLPQHLIRNAAGA